MSWRRGQTYSQDLRDRVLMADDESAREVAERLGVSASYVVKARQRRDRDGRLTAGGQRASAQPRLAELHAAIDAHVHEHPDGTLREMRAWLLRTHGVSVSMGTMWNTLRRLEMTLKKRPSRRASGRVGMSPKHAMPGIPCAPISIPES